MTSGALSAFAKRNIVAVVMIPSLIVMHYGWHVLQNVDSLVKEEERKPNFPLVDLLKKLTHGGATELDSNIRQFRHSAD